MEDTKHEISLDLTQQLKLAKRETALQKKIYNLLCDIALEQGQETKLGALVVLGQYTKTDYLIPGMRQIQQNPVEGQLIKIADKTIKEKFQELFRNDGALIIDQFGQVLAGKVYIQVDHGEIAVDEECSTRHITAASVSLRSDIIAAFTISEETGKVRWYVDGKQEEHFNPVVAQQSEEEVDEVDEDL